MEGTFLPPSYQQIIHLISSKQLCEMEFILTGATAAATATATATATAAANDPRFPVGDSLTVGPADVVRFRDGRFQLIKRRKKGPHQR